MQGCGKNGSAGTLLTVRAFAVLSKFYLIFMEMYSDTSPGLNKAGRSEVVLMKFRS